MIHPNELRLGNYIYIDAPISNEGKTIRVTAYHLIELNDKTTPFKPIPLTEEWLLKFGFRFGKGGNYYELAFMEVAQYENKDWSFTYLNNLIKVNLKYVHSLQNLYFALTNQELTIKT